MAFRPCWPRGSAARRRPWARRRRRLDPAASDELEDEHTALATALISGTFDRRAYYELAAHIEHEEMELFPLAMFGFDDDDWAVLEATPRFLAPDAVLVR